TVPMKLCNRRSDSFAVTPAKGPEPRSIAQIAIPDSTAMSTAASRCLNRNAAHRRGRVQKNVSRNVLSPKKTTPSPNTASPTRIVTRQRQAASRGRRRTKAGRGGWVHRVRGGGTMGAPVLSPEEQGGQEAPESAGEA